VVLALMSTGPVGISDIRGMTNATLIKRTIRKDGLLLKPSKAITSVDSSLARSATKPPGHVYTSYSATARDTVNAWHFVSFKMTEAWNLSLADFYPKLVASSNMIVHRSFRDACANGTAASTCVEHSPLPTQGSVLTLPKSDQSNVTGGTDLAPVVTTVWPVCSSGWVLLGELSKYVPISSVRFEEVSCTELGLSATVNGVPGEAVEVTLLRPEQGKLAAAVFTQLVSIPASGIQQLIFASDSQLIV